MHGYLFQRLGDSSLQNDQHVFHAGERATAMASCAIVTIIRVGIVRQKVFQQSRIDASVRSQQEVQDHQADERSDEENPATPWTTQTAEREQH